MRKKPLGISSCMTEYNKKGSSSMKDDPFLFVMFTSRHDLEHLTYKISIDVLG